MTIANDPECRSDDWTSESCDTNATYGSSLPITGRRGSLRPATIRAAEAHR